MCQRLVILGQFEISVQKGQITLLGATLQPSKSKYKVYVPLSHSLPVIRCLATDISKAEICLHQFESGLEPLRRLSPLFGRLWNDGSSPMGNNYKTLSKIEKSSFEIVSCSNIYLRQTNMTGSSFRLTTGPKRHFCNRSSQHQSGMRHYQDFQLNMINMRHVL